MLDHSYCCLAMCLQISYCSLPYDALFSLYFLPVLHKRPVAVEGRMKVEDGGKRGLTPPFWLRIVVQHGFPCGVSWRSIPQETTDAKQSATASPRAAQRAV